MKLKVQRVLVLFFLSFQRGEKNLRQLGSNGFVSVFLEEKLLMQPHTSWGAYTNFLLRRNAEIFGIHILYLEIERERRVKILK